MEQIPNYDEWKLDSGQEVEPECYCNGCGCLCTREMFSTRWMVESARIVWMRNTRRFCDG